MNRARWRVEVGEIAVIEWGKSGHTPFTGINPDQNWIDDDDLLYMKQLQMMVQYIDLTCFPCRHACGTQGLDLGMLYVPPVFCYISPEARSSIPLHCRLFFNKPLRSYFWLATLPCSFWSPRQGCSMHIYAFLSLP